MTEAASTLLHAGSAALCLVWGILVLCVGRGWRALLPAAVCVASAVWAGALALAPTQPLYGLAGMAEVLRDAVWLILLISLCGRTRGPGATAMIRGFSVAGGVAVLLAVAAQLPAATDALAIPTLGSPLLLARLLLPLVIVLLAENLYWNADEATRWHINLPCIALAGLSAFDIWLYAEGALSHAFSPVLLDARAALTALVMPLLAIGAQRDRRWRRDPPISRAVMFHGATLVVAGTFLVGVGAAGEAFRHLGVAWGPTAQVGLLAGAVMVLAVAAASGSVRSRLRRTIVDHFFTARYDYRREWLRCVAALSAPDSEITPAIRAIRAIADAVDSPAGALLLRELGDASLRWIGSWNLPDEPHSLAPEHPLIAALHEGVVVAELTDSRAGELIALYGPLWLATPLVHHREGLIGVVLLAPPRATFPLDQEVFDLLQALGREVAMFWAERRAAERLAEQRRVQDYAKRFTFVAHDVKTVASQLSLLLANADENITDPEFQRDLLFTVRASVTRINTLITRLRQPGSDADLDKPQNPAGLAPVERLRRIAEKQLHPVLVEADEEPIGVAAMASERFDTAVSHLLNNAIEASLPGEPVRIKVRRRAGRILIDIVDRGMGMTSEFIRDELFKPLSSSKARGSGIGAWQARELLREAGGDVTVLSEPDAGTTMRLSLPARRDEPLTRTSGAEVLEMGS